MQRTTTSRAAERITRLAREPNDLVGFWSAASQVIAGVVPHHWTPCWYTLDPASLLITSHYHYGMAEFPPAWLAEEYCGDDVHRLVDVVRSDAGISTLHEVTGGNPASSPRWHRNLTVGGDQELIARLQTRSGQVWGMLGLYREPGRPLFDEADKQFLLAITPQLAEGARRALLVGEAIDPERPDAPGLLILTDRWEIDSTTPGVEHWLAQLPDGDWEAGRLPSAVLSVAGQAAALAGDRAGAEQTATVRTRSTGGTWVILHAAPLDRSDRRRVAVIVEPAHPARIQPILMSAYGLTEREQDITRLVLSGHSTTEIAAELAITAHTVQDHLKSIFDKTGVRSRRDLVAKVFYTHYEPRLRDNEHRTAANKPVRGGPVYRPTRLMPSPGRG